MPQNFMEWIAYAALIIPLMVLAWSALRYVQELKRERERYEYQRVFEVMDHLGQSGGSIASKLAAAYELRKFKHYKDVIIRMCDDVPVAGPAGEVLKRELQLTKDHLSK